MNELKIPHRIYRKFNLFVAKANGEMTYNDLYQHVLELMSDPYFKPGTNGLYDFSNVTRLSGDLSQWEALANGMNDTEVIPEKASTAIVIDKKNVQLHNVLEDYLKMTASSQIDYRIFNELEWHHAMAHVGVEEFSCLLDFESSCN